MQKQMKPNRIFNCIIFSVILLNLTACKQERVFQEKNNDAINIMNQDIIMKNLDSLEKIEDNSQYIVKGYIQDEEINKSTDKFINYIHNVSMDTVEFNRISEKQQQKLVLEYDESAFEDILEVDQANIQDVYTLRKFVVTQIIKQEPNERDSIFFLQDRKEPLKIEENDIIVIREPVVKFCYKNINYTYCMYNYKEMEKEKMYILCLNDTYSSDNSFYIIGYGMGCFACNEEEILSQGSTLENPFWSKMIEVKKAGIKKYEK